VPPSRPAYTSGQFLVRIPVVPRSWPALALMDWKVAVSTGLGCLPLDTEDALATGCQ
jgi:hypothetical protein